MRALTIRQPWASAIIYGDKRIENRSWRPPAELIGRRIYIHAGTRWTRAEAEIVDILAEFDLLDPSFPLIRGAILGTARIVDVAHAEDILPSGLMAFDDAWWDPLSEFGWVLDDVRALRKPLPAKGHLGLWRFEAADTMAT